MRPEIWPALRLEEGKREKTELINTISNGSE
jgi:hypothetical protein